MYHPHQAAFIPPGSSFYSGGMSMEDGKVLVSCVPPSSFKNRDPRYMRESLMDMNMANMLEFFILMFNPMKKGHNHYFHRRQKYEETMRVLQEPGKIACNINMVKEFLFDNPPMGVGHFIDDLIYSLSARSASTICADSFYGLFSPQANDGQQQSGLFPNRAEQILDEFASDLSGEYSSIVTDFPHDKVMSYDSETSEEEISSLDSEINLLGPVSTAAISPIDHRHLSSPYEHCEHASLPPMTGLYSWANPIVKTTPRQPGPLKETPASLSENCSTMKVSANLMSELYWECQDANDNSYAAVLSKGIPLHCEASKKFCLEEENFPTLGVSSDQASFTNGYWVPGYATNIFQQSTRMVRVSSRSSCKESIHSQQMYDDDDYEYLQKSSREKSRSTSSLDVHWEPVSTRYLTQNNCPQSNGMYPFPGDRKFVSFNQAHKYIPPKPVMGMDLFDTYNDVHTNPDNVWHQRPYNNEKQVWASSVENFIWHNAPMLDIENLYNIANELNEMYYNAGIYLDSFTGKYCIEYSINELYDCFPTPVSGSDQLRPSIWDYEDVHNIPSDRVKPPNKFDANFLAPRVNQEVDITDNDNNNINNDTIPTNMRGCVNWSFQNLEWLLSAMSDK